MRYNKKALAIIRSLQSFHNSFFRDITIAEINFKRLLSHEIILGKTPEIFHLQGFRGICNAIFPGKLCYINSMTRAKNFNQKMKILQATPISFREPLDSKVSIRQVSRELG
jgi:hypothetical protein